MGKLDIAYDQGCVVKFGHCKDKFTGAFSIGLQIFQANATPVGAGSDSEAQRLCNHLIAQIYSRAYDDLFFPFEGYGIALGVKGCFYAVGGPLVAV